MRRLGRHLQAWLIGISSSAMKLAVHLFALDPTTRRTTIMSATTAPRVQWARSSKILATVAGRSGIVTRRHLQIVLGLLWLLDGVLQAQPFMFTRDFATQTIAG